jgi:hypothetical protein
MLPDRSISRESRNINQDSHTHTQDIRCAAWCIHLIIVLKCVLLHNNVAEFTTKKFVDSIDAERTQFLQGIKKLFRTEEQSVSNESSLTGMHTVPYNPAFSNTFLYSNQVNQE